MRNEIDTEPDLEVKSNNVITRVWNLGSRINLPVQFASPELCMVAFADQTSVWKIAQLVTPERIVDITLESLSPVEIVTDFYDFDGKNRLPSLEEERAIGKIVRIVDQVIQQYGTDGTLI